MSDQPSQESEDLTSGLSGQACASCGRQKSMSGAGECCDGIGPTPKSTTTSGGLVSGVPTSSRIYAETGVAPTLQAANSPTRGGTDGPLVSISSAGDSPAKTSQLQASGQDSQASGQDCSLSSPGSQMSFDQLGSSLKTSLGSSPLPTDETWESFSQRWPKSGTASAGEWSTLDTSESPSGAVECSLSDVLETTVSERFALSARAARGILRRADARGKTLPVELEQALRELAA